MRFSWRGTLTQPFASKFFNGIWRLHGKKTKFLTKTVMVQDGDVDAACALLNRLMEREGLLKIIRKTRYYQKPYMQRNELALEASRAIVKEDYEHKMRFLMRKQRADSHPGQITM